MSRRVRNMWTIGTAAALLAAGAAGVAVARPDATSASPITAAQAKKIAKSVADSEIKRLAPTLSVNKARTAVSANSPAMYAQVTATGGVTTNSLGIVQGNVVRVANGVYCFVGLPNPPKGGAVTIDAAIPGPGSGGDLAQVGLGRFVHRIGTCPEGSQAYVVTFPPDSPGPVDDPFFVVFWS